MSNNTIKDKPKESILLKALKRNQRVKRVTPTSQTFKASGYLVKIEFERSLAQFFENPTLASETIEQATWGRSVPYAFEYREWISEKWGQWHNGGHRRDGMLHPMNGGAFTAKSFKSYLNTHFCPIETQELEVFIREETWELIDKVAKYFGITREYWIAGCLNCRRDFDERK